MSADHKRKSRPIAPATVTVTPDSITVVVPDVLGKNESHVSGANGARHTSAATKRYRASVAAGFEAVKQACRDGAHVPCWAFFGAWRLEVLAVWPRERHAFDFKPCPMGDADAAIPQALDALQHAGILDDDARVVEVRAWNLYRKDQRATIIRLVRVPDLAARDKAIGHLLGLVPAAVPEPAKPARKPRRKATA